MLISIALVFYIIWIFGGTKSLYNHVSIYKMISVNDVALLFNSLHKINNNRPTYSYILYHTSLSAITLSLLVMNIFAYALYDLV